MWHQNTENPSDSDQSISDEEELDRPFPENCISLGDKKDDFVCSSRKALTLHSEEEMISSDEENSVFSKFSVTSGARDFQKVNFHSSGNEKQGMAETWHTISKEAEALVRGRASCSNANKLHKGNRGRENPKFSMLPRLLKDEVFWQSFPENGNVASPEHEYCSAYKDLEHHERMKNIECGTSEHSVDDILEDLQEEQEKHPVACNVSVEVVALACGNNQPSVAELLDGLQDKTCTLTGNSKKYIGTKERRELVVKRSLSTLGDRIIDDEDPPEPMDSDSSSDNEINEQNLKLNIPETTRQTMADVFQKALGSAISNDKGLRLAATKPSGIGLLGKLQQVMQLEKDKDAHFLRILQTRDTHYDEAKCIDVEILSRYLEAKLIVCHCLFSNNKKSFQWPESIKTTTEQDQIERAVIFNPRVCGGVELEVGSLIRIHPPWKEVQALSNDGSVILSTYFSLISQM